MIKFIKKSPRVLIQKRSDYVYHKNHKKKALRALRVIENEQDWILNKRFKKQITKYAIDTFGSKKYRYWLYVYTAYNKKFKSGWVPDNYFGRVILKKINKSYEKLSTMRTLSKKVLQTSLLPDAFYIINGLMFDKDYQVISKEAFFKEVEHGHNFYLKANLTSNGRGIIKITQKNYKQIDYSNCDDSVIQNEVKQHPWFNQIMPNNLATIRITTIKDNEGKITYGGSYLRFGRNNDEYIKGDSSINVFINDSSGSLNEFGIDSSWKRYTKHPDTHFVFSHQKIPYFEKALMICIDLHKNLPQISIIGFDVAIDKNGDIHILEYNSGHTDIKFHEASVGPILTHLI